MYRLASVAATVATTMLLAACGGGSDSASAPAPAPAPPKLPIAVEATSYLNKHKSIEAVGSIDLPNQKLVGVTYAYADFFQNGSYSLVTHSTPYVEVPNWQSQNPTTAPKGKIYFWQRVNNTWVDKTPTLLADTTGCLAARKAIVADFNKDGKPDVFFACFGFDAPPFPGEQQVLLLSQPNGTYSKSVLPFSGQVHSASSADVNGDGYPDILVTDTSTEFTPYFLTNNKDGAFAADKNRLPESVKYQPIFTAELVDFRGNGVVDTFLAGNEQNGFAPATIYANNGSGQFTSGAKTLPGLPGFGLALDISVYGKDIYLGRTIDANANFYTAYAIQKVNYDTLSSSQIYSHYGPYPTGYSWVPWIGGSGPNIVSMDSAFKLSVKK